MNRKLKYFWWWVTRRSSWHEYRLRCRLKEILLDSEPGLFPIFLWSHVDENTPAYDALSRALFDSSGEGPVEGAQKDLSDPRVREQIMQCVEEHAEILRAFVRLMQESQSAAPASWLVAKIDHQPLANNLLLNCTKYVERASETFGDFQVACGIVEADEETVSLAPVIDVVADDQAGEILLQTCPGLSESRESKSILTVAELDSRSKSLLANRPEYRVEFSEVSPDRSQEAEVDEFRIDFPVTAIGHHTDERVFVFLHVRT